MASARPADLGPLWSPLPAFSLPVPPSYTASHVSQTPCSPGARDPKHQKLLGVHPLTVNLKRPGEGALHQPGRPWARLPPIAVTGGQRLTRERWEHFRPPRRAERRRRDPRPGAGSWGSICASHTLFALGFFLLCWYWPLGAGAFGSPWALVSVVEASPRAIQWAKGGGHLQGGWVTHR